MLNRSRNVLHDLLRLALPQQSVIDEDAGELIADRLMDQHRGNRRIHPAREAADHPALPHLGADPRDLGGAEAGHGPGAGQAQHAMGEVAQQRRAVRRVHHLGMEQQPVEPPRIVGDGGERRALADRHGTEARRQAGDAVAVAHPHLLAPALVPDALEQHAVVRQIDERAAELAMVRALHLAAQLVAHGLHAVADAEDRHAGLEHRLRRARRGALGQAGRPARQDDAARPPGGDPVRVGVERPDLAIDAGLAQAAGDELGDLAAEVQDQHALGGERGGGGGIRQGIGHAGSGPCVILALGP